MFPRSQPSGAQNRKRKKRHEEIAQSIQGSLNRFIVRQSNENVVDENACDENSCDTNACDENVYVLLHGVLVYVPPLYLFWFWFNRTPSNCFLVFRLRIKGHFFGFLPWASGILGPALNFTAKHCKNLKNSKLLNENTVNVTFTVFFIVKVQFFFTFTTFSV